MSTKNLGPIDPPRAAEHDLMTVEETAGRLRISKQTLRNWQVTGRGPRSFLIGRRRLYARSDVDMWLAEQRLATK